MIAPTDDKPLVVITGSSGLIGQRVTDALVADFRIVGLDVAEPRQMPEGATWLQCDLTDDDNVQHTLGRIRDEYGSRCASVIHLAAYYDFSGETSEMYRKLTVEGTRRLIDGLQQFEQVEQFVFSSSLLAMRPLTDTRQELTEQSPTEAKWDYPRSKLEAERVLKEHQGGIPVAVLRIAGVYDEHGRSLPITQHIRRIYERQFESYFFPGDPTHGQAFVHLADLARCFARVVGKRHELSRWELFLIAEPDVMSHEELQDALGESIHGRQWPTIRIPKAVAKAGAWAKNKLTGEDAFIKPWMIDLADDHYAVAIDRARERLGWEPEHRLRDTLPTMIETLQRDPRGWYELNKLPVPASLRAEAAGE